MNLTYMHVSLSKWKPPLGQLKLKCQGNLRRVRGLMEMLCDGGKASWIMDKGGDKASRRHAAITKPRVVCGHGNGE